MPHVKLSEIKVGERFRKKFEDMEGLMTSIRTHGLIEPIILDENNVLIAGERRLRAHQMLAIPEIEVKYMHDLTPLQKMEVELEENIQRREFTWQEEVTAKEQLHKLKQSLHPKDEWGVRETAAALDQSTGTVSMDIQIAIGMKAFPELMKEKNKSTAFKKLKMLQEQILRAELSRRMKVSGLIDAPNIILGDGVEEMKKMPMESVDLVLTDPPWGINIGKAQTFGRTSAQVTYEDSEAYALDLMDRAIAQYMRVLKNNKHLLMFCGIQMFPAVSVLLSKHGFNVWRLPLIWDKGSGSYPSQSKSFTHSYEAMVHAVKGSAVIQGTPRDILTYKRVPPGDKIHASEKPPELIRDLINLLSLPGEVVLDSFAGSGVMAEAARDTNRQSISIELDAENHRRILERMKKGGANGIEHEEV